LEPPGEIPGPSLGSRDIYIASANGSNARRLVAGGEPTWSPDGGRVAYQRDGTIHVIGTDGTGETVLGEGREPAWSPDGSQLAFTSFDGIALMGDDGTAITTIVRHDFRDDTWAASDMGVGKPAWSPDGNRIAFEHLGDGEMVPAQIFIVNADGSGLRRVTPTERGQYAESDPSWSPDGSRLVFWSYGYGIAVVAAAGGLPTGIYLNLPAVTYGASPSWSPDGRTIAFTAEWFTATSPAVWVVSSAGGRAVALIAAAADPAWSPDGTKLAFTRLQELNR
jgi:Tol biopolymer transport system component